MSFSQEWNKVYSDGFSTRYPFESVIRFVVRLKRSHGTGKVLEVGCGTGGNLTCVYDEGFEAFGVDASEEAITKCKEFLARRNISAQVAVSDIAQLPFPDEYFEGIFDRATISHVGDVAAGTQAIVCLERKLKRGGKLLFTPFSSEDSSYSFATDNGNGLMQGKQRGSISDFGNICFYTKRDIFEIAKRSALQIESLSHHRNESDVDGARTVGAHWEVVFRKQ